MFEIDAIKFYPLEARYLLQRGANAVGRRIGESLSGRMQVWVDAHATDNISQANQIDLWRFATETKDPLHRICATWYSEDGDRVLTSVEFMGWISTFTYTNPRITGLTGVQGVPNGPQDTLAMAGYNNLLYLELIVVLDESNISRHKFTK